jgi:hypothetical protein
MGPKHSQNNAQSDDKCKIKIFIKINKKRKIRKI